MSDSDKDANEGDESPKVKAEESKVDAAATTSAIKQQIPSSTKDTNSNIAAAESGTRVITMASKVYEPSPFVSETKCYDTYKEDLCM